MIWCCQLFICNFLASDQLMALLTATHIACKVCPLIEIHTAIKRRRWLAHIECAPLCFNDPTGISQLYATAYFCMPLYAFCKCVMFTIQTVQCYSFHTAVVQVFSASFWSLKNDLIGNYGQSCDFYISDISFDLRKADRLCKPGFFRKLIVTNTIKYCMRFCVFFKLAFVT